MQCTVLHWLQEYVLSPKRRDLQRGHFSTSTAGRFWVAFVTRMWGACLWCVDLIFPPFPLRSTLKYHANSNQTVNASSLWDEYDLRLTWTDCEEAEDYVVPNVLSPSDLVFRPDRHNVMDETVKSSWIAKMTAKMATNIYVFIVKITITMFYVFTKQVQVAHNKNGFHQNPLFTFSLQTQDSLRQHAYADANYEVPEEVQAGIHGIHGLVWRQKYK